MDAPGAPHCLLLLVGILLQGPAHSVEGPTMYGTKPGCRPTSTEARAGILEVDGHSLRSASLRPMPLVFRFLRQDAVVHTVNTTNAEAMYQLLPARAGDSGAYECRLQVEEKVKSSLGLTLTVTGLQTPEFQLNTSELYESEEVEASCAAPQEKGRLRFNFFQQQRVRPAAGVGGEVTEVTLLKSVDSMGNQLKTKLLLRDIGHREMFCNYSMPMLSQAGSSNSSSRLLVLVKGLFISPVMNVLPSGNVIEGDVVELVCKVVNPPGGVGVYLNKDQKVLKWAAVGLSHLITVGVADSGEYVCKAVYGATQKETFKTIRRLSITCAIDSYSPERLSNEDIRYLLSHNGKPLSLNGEATYTAVAHASLNGNYSCKAEAGTHTGGKIVKKSPTLVVKAKVPVSQPVLSVVGGRLVLGKPFALRCHSDNGSLPITYTLHGPRRPVQILEVGGGPGGKQAAIFNTSAVQKGADLPLFLCRASNNKINAPLASLGHELLSTEIIEPVSQPLLTLFPDAAHVSEGQDLTLLCVVLRGTLPVTFTWYSAERPQSPLAFQTRPGTKGSYTISGVGRAHSGGYYCEGSNAAGNMAGWKKGLIAVICILLLLAAVLAIMFKKGLLRGRRSKKLSMKSASTHPERLSLTKAEADDAVNDTDEQNSVAAPEETEPTVYTEIQTRPLDPSRVKTPGTDAMVYSEVRKSKQGVSEETADGVCRGSVEYAQLNNDNTRRNSAHRNSAHRNSNIG
ncbi:hypothetical protein CRUP_032857, partial [Coryphaenoides rupestris]